MKLTPIGGRTLRSLDFNQGGTGTGLSDEVDGNYALDFSALRAAMAGTARAPTATEPDPAAIIQSVGNSFQVNTASAGDQDQSSVVTLSNGGLTLGALAPGAFVIGTAAGDADDRIIYNSTTGQLYFDADGSGAGAAVLFAILQGAPAITASDFTVI